MWLTREAYTWLSVVGPGLEWEQKLGELSVMSRVLATVCLYIQPLGWVLGAGNSSWGGGGGGSPLTPTPECSPTRSGGHSGRRSGWGSGPSGGG